jgi:hypothetical protein
MTAQLPLALDDIDQSNSPEGMTSIRKAELKTTENICNHCDYRRVGCQQGGQQMIRCMPWARPDGVSVLFKRVAL